MGVPSESDVILGAVLSSIGCSGRAIDVTGPLRNAACPLDASRLCERDGAKFASLGQPWLHARLPWALRSYEQCQKRAEGLWPGLQAAQKSSTSTAVGEFVGDRLRGHSRNYARKGSSGAGTAEREPQVSGPRWALDGPLHQLAEKGDSVEIAEIKIRVGACLLFLESVIPSPV